VARCKAKAGKGTRVSEGYDNTCVHDHVPLYATLSCLTQHACALCVYMMIERTLVDLVGDSDSMSICMYIYIYIYICILIYFIYIHIHTYLHIYTRTLVDLVGDADEHEQTLQQVTLPQQILHTHKHKQDPIF
jgi:amino acid permease